MRDRFVNPLKRPPRPHPHADGKVRLRAAAVVVDAGVERRRDVPCREEQVDGVAHALQRLVLRLRGTR